MSKKIAVTGALGFIGSALVKLLESSEYEIIRIASNHAHLNEKRRVCDIIDPITTAKALSDADVVVHLAGISSPAACVDNFHHTYQVNVQGTKNVIEATKSKKLIFASSSHVYGKPVSNGICREDDPSCGASPYAISKMIGEMLCKNYSKNYGHKINVVRFFNIYGENQPLHYIIPFMMSQALRTGKISIRRLNIIRDFLYVHDSARAILSIITKDEWCNTYNIGSGIGTPLSKIADYISNRIDGITLHDENFLTEEPAEMFADTEKLKSIGWSQQVSLEQGLDKVFEHLRSSLSS